MDQLKRLFAALSLRQKAGIAATALLVLAGMTGFVHWKHERDFKPLFTGMSPEDAAAVVQKLKESGAEYRISDNGGSVLVSETRLDELRLEMAGAGLPKTGRIGFELFDKANLGITDFTEHVNYRRALEGELERSVKALSQVEQARVHVTFPKDSVFLDSREPAKASVLVRLRPGAHLSPQNVTAVTNLVASAVEGLAPEFVSVLDMQGNLLSRPRMLAMDGENTQAALDYKHQVEKDLVSKVESTLEPVLGAGRFRVGVSADCDLTSGDQSEELFDPSKSVMLTQQKSEDIAGVTQTAGVPGTAANLPNAVPRAATPSTMSRRTENVAYQTSRVVKHTKIPQGAIKRISASLIIDQDVEWQGKGKQKKRIFVPPSPEKLKAIHDLAAGVLGLVPDRGDQLVIESLPFEQSNPIEPSDEVSSKPSSSPKTWNSLPFAVRVGVIAGASVFLLLCVGGLFFFRRKRKPVQLVEVASSLPAAAAEADKPAAQVDSAHPPTQAFEPALAKLQLPPMTKKVEFLRDHLKENVKQDPAFAASVLRGWLEEDAK